VNNRQLEQRKSTDGLTFLLHDRTWSCNVRPIYAVGQGYGYASPVVTLISTKDLFQGGGPRALYATVETTLVTVISVFLIVSTCLVPPVTLLCVGEPAALEAESGVFLL